jgi:prepilin-type N-terminal cleavage/methylation domain-containing protein
MKLNNIMTGTKTSTLTNKMKRGFTLIEVIAVLVLLGILAAIAVPKYIDMAASARGKAIDAGISEMNGREALTWGNAMLATNGFSADALPADTDLNAGTGTDYVWSVAPSMSTPFGSIAFQGSTAVALTRTVSTGSQPAVWSR